MKAATVTTEVLQRYADDRLAQGASNATVNRELSNLRRAFRLGFRATPRKVGMVPMFPHLTEAQPRKGFVTEVQYKLLCDNAVELWFRTALALGYVYGFRRGEILSLKVAQVDLLNRMIDLGETKNGESRKVSMTNEVYELMRACISNKSAEGAVLTRDDNPVLDFRGTWWAACEKAGLGRWIEAQDGKRHWRGLIFHDLRRSAVRNMVRRGVPEKVAMAISGHKTRSVFDRYNITDERDLVTAATLIERGAKQELRKFGHSLGIGKYLGKAKMALKPV